MSGFKNPSVEEAADTIDAAIFTGDSFHNNQKEREKLREIMKRWERGLKEIDASDKAHVHVD